MKIATQYIALVFTIVLYSQITRAQDVFFLELLGFSLNKDQVFQPPASAVLIPRESEKNLSISLLGITITATQDSLPDTQKIYALEKEWYIQDLNSDDVKSAWITIRNEWKKTSLGMDNEIKSIRDKLAASEHKLEASEHEKFRAYRENDKVKEDLQKFQQTASAEKKELEKKATENLACQTADIKKKFWERYQNLQERMKTKKAEIKTLKASLEPLEKKETSLTIQNKLLEEAQKKTDMTIAEMTDQNKSLLDTQQQLTSKIKELTTQNKKLEEAQEKKVSTLTALAAENTQLSASSEAKSSHQLEYDINRLTKKHSGDINKLSNALNKAQEKEKEISETLSTTLAILHERNSEMESLRCALTLLEDERKQLEDAAQKKDDIIKKKDNEISAKASTIYTLKYSMESMQHTLKYSMESLQKVQTAGAGRSSSSKASNSDFKELSLTQGSSKRHNLDCLSHALIEATKSHENCEIASSAIVTALNYSMPNTSSNKELYDKKLSEIARIINTPVLLITPPSDGRFSHVATIYYTNINKKELEINALKLTLSDLEPTQRVTIGLIPGNQAEGTCDHFVYLKQSTND